MDSLKLLALASFASLNLAHAAPLTTADVRARFELRTDIYTLDASGKKLVSGPAFTGVARMNPDSGRIDDSHGGHFNGNKLFIHDTWSVLDDGTIKVSIEEYSDEKDHKFLGLLQKKEWVLENFEPISWQSQQKNPERLLIRFVPALREVARATSMDGVPLSGKDVIVTDSEGYLWADELQVSGKYAGFTSHRGTLVLSYQPFKGAQELGAAEGKDMDLKASKKLTIKLHSATDFLPAGLTAKVYGIFKSDKRSKKVNSVHSWGSDSEAKALDELNNAN